MKPFFALVVAVAVSSASSVARADDPPAAPGYEKHEVSKEYVAPLYQTTQPTYVPQSVALSGPAELALGERTTIPPGYTPVQRTRRGAIIGGACVLGSLYFLSIYAAMIASDSYDHDSLGALWIPGLGPFIQMANTESSVGRATLMIDGMGQALGIGLVLYGMLSPKTVLVRNDLAKAKVTVRPVPLVGTSVGGVGLGGTF